VSAIDSVRAPKTENICTDGAEIFHRGILKGIAKQQRQHPVLGMSFMLYLGECPSLGKVKVFRGAVAGQWNHVILSTMAANIAL